LTKYRFFTFGKRTTQNPKEKHLLKYIEEIEAKGKVLSKEIKKENIIENEICDSLIAS